MQCQLKAHASLLAIIRVPGNRITLVPSGELHNATYYTLLRICQRNIPFYGRRPYIMTAKEVKSEGGS